MSIDPVTSVAVDASEIATDALARLQDLLYSAMEGVMAAEGDPIRKANSLARLAGHYLKTCQVTAAKHAYQHLAARVAALEQVAEALAGLVVKNDECLAGDQAG